MFPLADIDQHGGIASAVAICAAHGLKQQQRKYVLLQESATPGAVCVRTAAVRTLISVSEHADTSKFYWKLADRQLSFIIVPSARDAGIVAEVRRVLVNRPAAVLRCGAAKSGSLDS